MIKEQQAWLVSLRTKGSPPHGVNGEPLRVAPIGKPGHGADPRQIPLDLDRSIAATFESLAGPVVAAIGRTAQCKTPKG